MRLWKEMRLTAEDISFNRKQLFLRVETGQQGFFFFGFQSSQRRLGIKKPKKQSRNRFQLIAKGVLESRSSKGRTWCELSSCMEEKRRVKAGGMPGLAFLFFSVSSFFFLLPLLPLLERGRVFFFLRQEAVKGVANYFNENPMEFCVWWLKLVKIWFCWKMVLYPRKDFLWSERKPDKNDRVRGKCRICNNNVAFCLTDGPNSNYYALQD